MTILNVPPGRRYKVPPTPVPKKIQDQNNMFMDVRKRYPDLDLGVTDRRPDLPYFADQEVTV